MTNEEYLKGLQTLTLNGQKVYSDSTLKSMKKEYEEYIRQMKPREDEE